MIKDFIFPNRNRFKIVGETEEHYLLEYYKNNQLVEDFYIPKQDSEGMIRNAILFWYSARYLIKAPSNTTIKQNKS